MMKCYSKRSLIFLSVFFLFTLFSALGQEAILRINAGGTEITYNNQEFIADSYANTGTILDRPQTGLPEPYQSFRFSRSQEMTYNIPIPDGEYTVNLYFAELWFGATGGGAGGAGSRVFDVNIEGQLAEDNLDIFAEVGADAMLMKSHTITVTGGILNIDFNSTDAVGGERHPVINAIEILSNTTTVPDITIESIPNQTNTISETVNLNIVANGGDPAANFSFAISGEPSGIVIDATTGTISGTIAINAANDGPSNDGNYEVTVTASKVGSSNESIVFDWTITDSTCSWNALSDANINRFEAISQKIGDKLYILGGFTHGVLVIPETEIYDTTNDIYAFGASMPIPVTHTAAVAVGSDIWILGGFAGDNPGVATNAVQVYNTLTNSWSIGPDLPNAIGSGAGALSGTKIHFFGGLLPDRQTDVEDHLVLDLTNVGAGWTSAAPMPNARNHHSGISVNGIVYAIGGQTGHDGAVQDTQFVHAYDPSTDQWTRMADLARPRSHFKAATTIHNGKIIIVGGVDNGPLVNDISQYDPQLNTWSELCKLPGEGLEEGAAQAFGDRLIVSGGRPVRDANIMLKETRWMQLDADTSQPPVADAGENQTITLPTDTITINGSGFDPDGGAVNYLWAQSSGPNLAVLDNETANNLNVSGLLEGIYVFRLTVTDDENESTSDTLQVTVVDLTGENLDSDFDGVLNEFDQCPSTQIGEDVDENGCEFVNVIYEYTVNNASKWFGGDNRPQFAPRNVGTGQSIFFETDVILESFSTKFSREFDFSFSPDNFGHEVELVLQLRDSNGLIISSVDKTLPSRFAGGWVRFVFDSPMELEGNSTYNFTWYLKDGFTNLLNTGSNGDSNSAYEFGNGFSATVRENGSDLDNFELWFEHPWDFLFKVTGEKLEDPEPDFALRINTGGTMTSYGGEDFSADQYSNTGSTLDRPQTGLPEPFQSFRFSRSQQMSYDIPVPDGEYTVNLYFAELWFGATGGGSGGTGSRVFDVSIEGQLAEDNLDIFSEVGADAMLVKSHTVTVTGGVLDIDFDSRDAVGGQRHPVVNAIEILGEQTSQDLAIEGFVVERSPRSGDSGTSLHTLNDGDQIRYWEYDQRVYLVGAEISRDVRSVLYEYTNALGSTETEAYNVINGYIQYVLPGVQVGIYTITATPYSEADQSGVAGTPVTISYEILDQCSGVTIEVVNASTCDANDGYAIIRDEAHNYFPSYDFVPQLNVEYDQDLDALVARNLSAGTYNLDFYEDYGCTEAMPFEIGTDNCEETRPFITTWKTDNPGTSDDNQITIPTFTGENYNYNIDWGDGTSDSGVTGDITHTYTVSGTYQVAISGQFPRIYFNNSFENRSADDDKIIEINQWGTNSWSSMQSAFAGCTNLDILASDIPDLSNMNDLGFTFYGCSSLIGNSSMENWETNTITNLTLTFKGCELFNQNIGNWSVANVFSLNGFLSGASTFDQNLSSWSVGNVTNFGSLFADAASFNQDISSWDVSNATSMNGMFFGANNFNQDLSQWEVGNVTDFTLMFDSVLNFNADLSSWDLSKATTIGGMFQDATSFNQDLSNWNVSNVEYMGNLFNSSGLSDQNYDATLIGWSNMANLKNDVILTADTNEYCQSEAARQKLIDDFGWLITDGGKSADCVDTTSFITTWKTDNIGLSEDNQITIPIQQGEIYNYTVDWGDGSTTENVMGNITHTYEAPGTYTVSISGDFPRIRFVDNQFTSGVESDSHKILSVDQWGNNVWSSMHHAFVGCANLDVIANDSPDLSLVSSTANMFADCRSLIGTNQFSNWETSNVSNMSGMFIRASAFNNANINNWDVSNVTQMNAMFLQASIFNQDLNNWQVGNVLNTTDMFAHATSFNSNIGTWDVGNVLSMDGMFFNTPFNSDISQWNVGNVRVMDGMFGSSSFNRNISDWDVSNVIDMSSMFIRTDFNQDIGGWDVSNVTDMNYMFFNAKDFDQNLEGWQVTNVTDMSNMLSDSGLSDENYDKTLIGWSLLPTLRNGVQLDAHQNQYCLGDEARQKLIDDFGWVITDGGKNATCVVANGDDIWLEAECATVGNNWSFVSDTSASNGQYVLPPTGFSSSGSNNADNIVKFDFNASVGTYKIYALVKTATTFDDSFYVRVNGGAWKRWNNIPQIDSFEWNQIHDRELVDVPLTFNLYDGVNTLEIANREDGAGLDKVYITKSDNAPSGFGVTDNSCSSDLSGRSFVANPSILSPNPVINSTTLSFEKPVELIQIQVYDITGRLVHSYNGSETEDHGAYILNVTTLPTGTYFLKAQDATGEFHQKQMVIKK